MECEIGNSAATVPSAVPLLPARSEDITQRLSQAPSSPTEWLMHMSLDGGKAPRAAGRVPSGVTLRRRQQLPQEQQHPALRASSSSVPLGSPSDSFNPLQAALSQLQAWAQAAAEVCDASVELPRGSFLAGNASSSLSLSASLSLSLPGGGMRDSTEASAAAPLTADELKQRCEAMLVAAASLRAKHVQEALECVGRAFEADR